MYIYIYNKRYYFKTCVYHISSVKSSVADPVGFGSFESPKTGTVEPDPNLVNKGPIILYGGSI